MELLSSEYGWTPNQIRELREEDIKNYLTIIQIKRKLAEKENKKYGRK